MSDLTVATLRLHPECGGTRPVLSPVGFETRESPDGHRAGWSSALDRLQALFGAP